MSNIFEYKNKNSDPKFLARAKVSSSVVSIAAVLCVMHAPKIAAQQTTTEGQTPAQTEVTQPDVSPKQGEPKSKANQSQLPPIQVRAKKSQPKRTRTATPATPQPGAESATSTSAQSDTGYRATNPGLTRLPTTLVNTPQSVSVVTRQVIQEQNSPSVRDALRNVAGITFRAGEGGNQGDTPYIRGFQSNNDIFRDGIRDPGWYTRNSFSIDAIEVYKGPSSFLFGRGSTGGVVNLISRVPVDRNYTELQVTANTGPGVRTQLDANRVFDENWSGRIVAMTQNYDIPGRDHVEENRWGIAPSLAWKNNQGTKVILSYIHQHDYSIPDYGIPFLSAVWGVPRQLSPVPHSNWYGILSGPLPDTEKLDADVWTGRIEHEFSKNLKVTNTTRYTDVDHLQRNVFPEPNTAAAGFPQPPNLSSTWTPNRRQIAISNTLLANQTDLRANINTGPIEHTMAAGLDLIRETRDFQRNDFAGQGATNFINPDPWRSGGTLQPSTGSQLTYGVSNQIGVFVADQAKLNKFFEVLGAIRYDQFRFKQDAPLAVASIQHLEHTDNFTSWRVGAVYHPWENSSLYVMRGTSFNPTADGLSISVSTPASALSQIALGPEKSETSEIGFKADVLDKQLTLATAVFKTEKTNLRVPDPANASLSVLDGLVRVLGFEASATGKLTNEWSVIASYSHINAKIVKTTVAAQLNNEPQITPEHSFSLWTTYDVTKEFQVGGGAFYNSSSWADLPNTAIVPAYWRFDAMAAYKLTKEITMQLNIYNLTNAFYAAGAYTNWIAPGAARSAALTMRGRF